MFSNTFKQEQRNNEEPAVMKTSDKKWIEIENPKTYQHVLPYTEHVC